MDDKRLTRIEDKLDSISTTLAANTESLTYHIKRTDMLEAELKPIRSRMDMVMGAAKLIAMAGVLVALVEAIRMFK